MTAKTSTARPPKVMTSERARYRALRGGTTGPASQAARIAAIGAAAPRRATIGSRRMKAATSSPSTTVAAIFGASCAIESFAICSIPSPQECRRCCGQEPDDRVVEQHRMVVGAEERRKNRPAASTRGIGALKISVLAPSSCA